MIALTFSKSTKLIASSIAVAVLLAAALTLLFVAHASSSNGADAGAGVAAPPDVPVVAWVTTKKFDGLGATVSPPPVGAVPAVSQDSLLEKVTDNNFAKTIAGGKVPAQVSLVTYQNSFGDQQEDGSETPSVPQQLAWLVEYTGVRSAHSVPLGSGTEVPSIAVCTVYVAVSARTGANLDGFSDCVDEAH